MILIMEFAHDQQGRNPNYAIGEEVFTVKKIFTNDNPNKKGINYNG